LQETPMRAHSEPADIATAICFLASDEARYITGEILNVAAGW
jgi:dihydroxycyclohexadiene carboxylate dehydrogenase